MGKLCWRFWQSDLVHTFTQKITKTRTKLHVVEDTSGASFLAPCHDRHSIKLHFNEKDKRLGYNTEVTSDCVSSREINDLSTQQGAGAQSSWPLTLKKLPLPCSHKHNFLNKNSRVVFRPRPMGSRAEPKQLRLNRFTHMPVHKTVLCVPKFFQRGKLCPPFGASFCLNSSESQTCTRSRLFRFWKWSWTGNLCRKEIDHIHVVPGVWEGVSGRLGLIASVRWGGGTFCTNCEKWRRTFVENQCMNKSTERRVVSVTSHNGEVRK